MIIQSLFLPRNLGYLTEKLKRNSDSCKKELDFVFKKYDLNGIIIGHTPQFSENDGISLTCNGNKDGKKVFVARVDNGSSQAFEGFSRTEKHNKSRKPQALVIENDGKTVYILNENGKKMVD